MNAYEQKVIGAIAGGILKPSAAGLDASDFSDRDLSVIFNLALQIEAEGKTVEPDLLYARSVETNAFYVADDFRLMAKSAQSRAVAFEAIGKIKAASLKNFLLSNAAEIALMKDAGGKEVFDRLKSLIGEAERFYSSAEESFKSIEERAGSVEAVITDLFKGVFYAVPTFFPQIDDKLLDGFSKGDLHLIVGQTGAGKSALALNFALNQAKHNIPVGFVTREMSSEENIMRFLASISDIPRWKMRREMLESTYKGLLDILSELKHYPVYFDDETEDIETLSFQARRLVENRRVEILYVDYLQLLTSKQKTDTRANEVQTISRELKKLAMSLKIPVVALVQFNNGVINASLFDVMNYIRESGSIKQDASTIQYIQVEQTEERKDVKEARWYPLKNRNGETFGDPVLLDFTGAHFRFTEKYA